HRSATRIQPRRFLPSAVGALLIWYDRNPQGDRAEPRWHRLGNREILRSALQSTAGTSRLYFDVDHVDAVEHAGRGPDYRREISHLFGWRLRWGTRSTVRDPGKRTGCALWLRCSYPDWRAGSRNRAARRLRSFEPYRHTGFRITPTGTNLALGL